ncbi:MAG: YciI family protein [Alphaproteobacteria bacterium]
MSKAILPGPDHMPVLGLRLYLIHSFPTETAHERHAHLSDHFRFMKDLEDKGQLFAAGPVLEEGDQSTGEGLIIIRAENRAEAEAIALSDPYHARGFRRFEVRAWLLNEGSFGLKIRLSDGRAEFE